MAILTPSQAIASVEPVLRGSPSFVAGSCVAAQAHGLPDGFSDLDVFVPTEQTLIATVQRFLTAGYDLDDRFGRVWERWLRFGLKGWHTNSMRLVSPNGLEVNVVFKITDGHATTSLAQVLESFDFGLLGMGYDMEDGLYRDLRPYLFPGYDLAGPLPLMPGKRTAWRAGFISQYNGLREAGRYAKYHDYGYDLSLVKEDLLTGYMMVSAYHRTSFDTNKHVLADIYDRLFELIDTDDMARLSQEYATIDFKDPLEEILEKLE